LLKTVILWFWYGFGLDFSFKTNLPHLLNYVYTELFYLIDGASDRYHDSRYSRSQSQGSRGSEGHRGVGGNGLLSVSEVSTRVVIRYVIVVWSIGQMYAVQLKGLLLKSH